MRFHAGDIVTITGKAGHAIPIGSTARVLQVDTDYMEPIYWVEVPGVLKQWVTSYDMVLCQPAPMTQSGDASVDIWVRESMKKLGGAAG